jgi:copper resistance protein B
VSRLVVLAGLAAALVADQAAAQTIDHGQTDHSQTPGMDQMPGMNMGGQGAPAPAVPETPQTETPQTGTPQTGTPQTEPPAWTGDYAADRAFDPHAMAHARAMAREEMGGMRFSKVMLNLFEYQTGGRPNGYRWDGQAWFGGDINRLVVRSEGEGGVKDGLEAGEVQALYSRAVSRYVDLQGGLRQDFAPVGRTYLTLGAQALLPWWLEVEGALFVATTGEVLARAEGTYDLRLTQRLVLQPRAELNFAAQDTAATRTGSGLSNAELGLRLRYEVRREFAPYVGVSWDRRVGRTADFVRAAGEDPAATRFVVGLRTWF